MWLQVRLPSLCLWIFSLHYENSNLNSLLTVIIQKQKVCGELQNVRREAAEGLFNYFLIFWYQPSCFSLWLQDMSMTRQQHNKRLRAESYLQIIFVNIDIDIIDIIKLKLSLHLFLPLHLQQNDFKIFQTISRMFHVYSMEAVHLLSTQPRVKPHSL